ncbi:hypothetical protein EEB13_22435 [Rhodococcus sp. WS3]|uniref:hypothetical protein n=1 Tax=Rhodococcus sp. WS3 TaxID=2486271 RepID=UPI001142E57F|nr:hypothetical protein [Rhodococcus sp. WS3]ROZ43851.1 hypothetical protein EEB13_22435 [Rhodococcus sp. WS3]
MIENSSHTTQSAADQNAVVEVSVEPIPDASKVGGKEGALATAWSDGRQPARPCTAHRTNGEPCRRAAINGGNVCGTHGGRSPQVKAKARVRLELAADRMAKELLGIATADDAPAAVKLAAIKDALDRAGLSAKTAVSVEVGPSKPFEELLTEMMEGGSRAESRAARGVPDELSADWRDILDAELVDDDYLEDAVHMPSRAVRERPAPASELQNPTSGGLMPMEDALNQLRATAPPLAPQARRRNR